MNNKIMNRKQLKNREIIIQDWVGQILYQGPYNSPKVNKVLDANRCTCSDDRDNCGECNGTGYVGDFEVMWTDASNQDNVYEWINY